MGNYLCHHGIKGMHWGIRRTPEELGHEKTKVFSEAEKRVRSGESNEYYRVEAEPIDIHDVMARSGLGIVDSIECAKIAMAKFNKAVEVEPAITKDIIESFSEAGCKAYGLEHRIKQPTSMAGKIGADAMDDGVDFKKSAESIKDSVRYTGILNDSKFVDQYGKIKGVLESKGYSEVRCKNYFTMYKTGKAMHKSVQSVFATKDGYPFEVQFQTVSSQAAKELKVPLYNERRQSEISAERAEELDRLMRALAEQVKNPIKISKIRNG